jgi:cation:H+ antiporter
MIDLVLQILVLAFSLILLASSGHFTIRAVEKIIELTGLSEISAGFVILAVLTSTPEITIAVFSVLEGTPGISVGDVLGSNVFNIAVVIGIVAMFGYLQTCCTELLVELTDVLFLTTLIPLLLVISHYHVLDVPSPVVGAILLATFALNIYYVLKKRTPPVRVEEPVAVKKRGSKAVVARLLLGFAGLVVAARLVVYSGANIAVFLGVPPILIGAKVVAIGTSLPELTLDLVAARRGRVQLAIGDVIGSNLTNLTLVLGLVLLTSQVPVAMTVLTEILPFLLITTIIFWRFLTRGGVSKLGGLVLLMTYIVFEAVLV